MKKVLLGILIGAVGVYGYGRLHRPAVAAGDAEEAEQQEFAETESAPSRTPAPEAASKADDFRCDGRRYCSQMTSYKEAVYFLRNCPDVKMDGDHDGIPCEDQFRFDR